MEQKKTARHQEVKSILQRFDGWEELKASIEKKDGPKVEKLIADLVVMFEHNQDTYIKRTVEIREELVEKLRIFCVTNGYKQKTIVNLGLEIILELFEE